MSVFEKIQTYNSGLSPTKVARKYKLLVSEPFRFFRGTNHLFYEDLSKAVMPNSPCCWICGDLHLENFGSYKGDNRLVYFDLNDFDESILAPVGWEIARVLTSILLAFDSFNITSEQALDACQVFLQKYTDVLSKGKPRFIETRTATGITRKFLRSVENRNQKELLSDRVTIRNGKLKLNHDHVKHLLVDKESKKRLRAAFENWLSDSNNGSPNNYVVRDINFRLAGTGSIGVKRYVFLIEKIEEPGKFMLIDMKEATASSLGPYVKVGQPAWASDAQRMETIQRVMQNVPPARLSTLEFEGVSYLMQELQPTRDRIRFKVIQDDFKQLCCVLQDMALLTASAHLRTVGRMNSCTADELMNFGKDTSWQRPILDYAKSYRQKLLDDYREFKIDLRLLKHRKKTAAVA